MSFSVISSKTTPSQMEISSLLPEPGAEWKRLLKFVNLNYAGGFQPPIKKNDKIAIFPLGR